MGKGAQADVARRPSLCPADDPSIPEEAKDKQLRWVVEGEVYDLTDFLGKHPGGADLLLWSVGRDITIPVMTYHKNPRKTVLPLMAKYKVSDNASAADVKKKIGIPHFLLPAGFDAHNDVPTYDFDFDNKELVLNTAREKILAPENQKAIKRLDDTFDWVVTAIVGVYCALTVSWLRGQVPWYAAVPAFVLLRTAMAGGGHYYVHRRKPHAGDALFDVNYVGMAFTAQDGHVLIHHAYTQSDADVKRGFFGGMMGIPRLFRVPVHTFHKFLHVCTGMFIRGVECELEKDTDSAQGVSTRLRRLGDVATGGKYRPPILWAFWAMHGWLFIEMALSIKAGVFGAWFAQFFCTLWFNTLMVVSSHDFTEVLLADSKDWAKYQIVNSHDMHITGCKWVDCFLSAGLSEHRSHHVFPYQKSGYANIYSTKFLKEAAEQHGMAWARPKKLFTEIMPVVFGAYVFAPVADPLVRKPIFASFAEEHLNLGVYKYCAGYILAGALGIGSI